MKIDRECINDNVVAICKEITDSVWDSITGKMGDDDVRFLIGDLAYLNGVCVFADKLKEVIAGAGELINNATQHAQHVESVEPIRLSDDGTLWVTVEDCDKAKRVIVESGTWCKTFHEEPMQWIPCSERLPKEEKRHYWVCTDTGYQCQCWWTNDVYGLGASDRWGWKIFDIPQYQKVIAWMPLPEPWKGADDE